MAFVFGLQTLSLINFTKIFQLKGLKPKNKGHTNLYECCGLTKKRISSLYISEFCHIGEKRTSFWKRQIVFVFYSSDQRPARVFTGFYSVIKIKKQALSAFKRYNPTAVVLLALCYILYLLHKYILCCFWVKNFKTPPSHFDYIIISWHHTREWNN